MATMEEYLKQLNYLKAKIGTGRITNKWVCDFTNECLKILREGRNLSANQTSKLRELYNGS